MICGQSRSSPSALAWELIDGKQWFGLCRLLRKTNAKLSVFRLRYISDANARIPLLSFALWRGAPLAIVEDFLEQYPDSVEAKDNKGRLPLHLACIGERSPAIIDLLLEYNGHLVMIQDLKGNIPLHYSVTAACRCSEENEESWSATSKLDPHLDVLTSLLVYYPQSVRVSNRLSETPVSLSRRLDRRAGRIVYNMLFCTNKTFNKAASRKSLRKSLTSEESTRPSSSAFMDLEPSSTFLDDMVGEIDWDDTERQAVGERPQRRNGIIIIICVPPALSEG
jgi:ankyrin repeat protein